MLSDIEVWNVSLKCHLGKYKTRFGTIKCNSVQLSDEQFLEHEYCMEKSLMPPVVEVRNFGWKCQLESYKIYFDTIKCK